MPETQLASSQDLESLFSEKSVDAVERLRLLVATNEGAKSAAKELLEATREKRGEARERHGILAWILGQPKAAAEALDGADGAHAAYALGQALRELSRWDASASTLRKAARSEKNLPARVALLHVRLELGEAEEVLKEAAAALKSGQDTADFHHVRGRALESRGDYAGAIDAFRAALERDPQHGPALFHLAYQCDLRGLDEEALELYERCAKLNPTYAAALVNLGVIYEDRGDYDLASGCFRAVLDARPDHVRAQLFLKDSEAAKHMYFDEEMEKIADERRLKLEKSISEFELSVRARNCLKNLNVETLGDLVKLREEDLLSLRNFGDTSLREVKKLLAEQGLRLGMPQEELLTYKPPVATPDLLEQPITDLRLSVRAQRCMDQLGITTVAALVSKSKTELMDSRNFGRVSLKEVMDKLAEMGLSLAEG